jgi:hypothetical protein
MPIKISCEYFNVIPKWIYLFTFSGGNSLSPVERGQSLLNFRQNFQISDNPPPPFALKKTVFSPLLGQNFRKFGNFPWRWGAAAPPAPPRFPPLFTLLVLTECPWEQSNRLISMHLKFELVLVTFINIPVSEFVFITFLNIPLFFIMTFWSSLRFTSVHICRNLCWPY